jgi:Holliday junction resolvase RusA-like endonuclease
VSKQKRAWREIAGILGQVQADEWNSKKKAQKSTIEFIFPVTQNRRRDPHNYYPTIKPIVDGLTDAGFWLDDTPEYVETREPIFYKGETVYVLIHQPKRS